MNAIIWLLTTVIDLYTFVLVVWVVMSWLISFNIVNRGQPFVERLNYALSRMVEPALRPIKKFMPDLGGLDISPIILIILLQFIERLLYGFYAPHIVIGG